MEKIRIAYQEAYASTFIDSAEIAKVTAVFQWPESFLIDENFKFTFKEVYPATFFLTTLSKNNITHVNKIDETEVDLSSYHEYVVVPHASYTILIAYVEKYFKIQLEKTNDYKNECLFLYYISKINQYLSENFENICSILGFSSKILTTDVLYYVTSKYNQNIVDIIDYEINFFHLIPQDFLMNKIEENKLDDRDNIEKFLSIVLSADSSNYAKKSHLFFQSIDELYNLCYKTNSNKNETDAHFKGLMEQLKRENCVQSYSMEIVL